MTREQFIELQNRGLDELFSLTAGEERARELFFQLALDTYDFLASAGITVLWGFRISGESPENYFDHNRGVPPVSASLAQRWHEWNAEYPRLLDRNPRLELMFKLKDIGESHSAASWPYGRERHIQQWVDAGDPSAPIPFDDRYGIVTPEFFERLRKLRRLTSGWFYWSDERNRVVFASEPEWQQVRAREELAEQERKRRREEETIKLQRLQRRLDEVLALARSDAAFWEALKAWELEQETQHRDEPQARVSVSGAVRLVARQMTPEEKYRSENPPLHPVFTEFVGRIQQADDIMSRRDIVINLRAEARRELGLDGNFRW